MPTNHHTETAALKQRNRAA